MRVPEEPVYIDLFRKNPVFTSLHLKYHVHVVPPLMYVSEVRKTMIATDFFVANEQKNTS
jgi:hypothetical protein